jgi:hypothetical protein
LHVIGNLKNIFNQPVRFSDVNYYLDGYQVAFTNYGPEGETLNPGETTKIMKGITGFTESTKVLEVRIVGFQKIGGTAPSSEPTAQSQTVFTKAPENPQTPAEVFAAFYFWLADKEFSKAEEIMAPDMLEYIHQYGEVEDITKNPRYYESKCVEIRIEKMEIEGDKAWVSSGTFRLDNGTVYPLGDVVIPLVKIDGKWKISLPDE